MTKLSSLIVLAVATIVVLLMSAAPCITLVAAANTTTIVTSTTTSQPATSTTTINPTTTIPAPPTTIPIGIDISFRLQLNQLVPMILSYNIAHLVGNSCTSSDVYVVLLDERNVTVKFLGVNASLWSHDFLYVVLPGEGGKSLGVVSYSYTYPGMPTAPPTPPPTPRPTTAPSPPGGDDDKRKIGIGVGVAGAVVVALVALYLFKTGKCSKSGGDNDGYKQLGGSRQDVNRGAHEV